MAYNAYGGPGEEREKPNPMVFGTPMQPKPRDSAGAAVPPMLGGNGGVNPQAATPSMAQGGAIPDGDDDDDMASNAGVQDDTTASLNRALQTINQLMMYGRKKNGLPTDEPKQQQDDTAPLDGAIPDDNGGGESYAEGGAIEDDTVAAHEQEFPDNAAPVEAAPAESVPDQQPQPDNMNPPEGNPIQAGAQATEGFLGNTFGPQGPIPNEGSEVPQRSLLPSTNGLSDAAGSAPLSSGGIVRNIIGYLQGKEALPPEVVKRTEDQVHGDPAQKAVGAVAKLAEKNPDAGFGAMQYNRAAYNAKAGFAYMALNGTAQKPPDLAAATKAATQATPHLLDGTLLTFAPGEGGVTASANGEKLNLTIPQFNQFLDIRKSGQYDQIFEKGGGLIALKEIMKGPGEPVGNLQTGTGTIGAAPTGPGRGIPQGTTPAGGGGPYAGPAAPGGQVEALRATQSDRAVNMGHNVTLLRSPAYDAANPDKVQRSQETPERVFRNDSDSNADRATRAFGTVGQGQKRQLYQDKLDAADADRKAKIEQAETRGETQEKVAGIRSKGTVDAAGVRGDTARDVEKSRSGDRQVRTDAQLKIAAEKLLQADRAEQGRNSRAVLSASEKTLVGMAAAGQKLTPDQKKRADDLIMSKEQLGAPRAPQPNASAPQMSQQDQQALLWANANPNDPRAAKIKQLHGVQ